MPTYAYLCTSCAHSFDIVQAITDDALTECPECGGELRKKFHPVGVTFKGSGFYRTDSRGGSASSESSPGTSSSDSTSGKDSTSGSSDKSGSNGSSSGSASSSKESTSSKPASTTSTGS